MQKRILIVNGYHDTWRYVPMGSFGICDYLGKNGIHSRMFNAAIYRKNNYLTKLNSVIRKYRPTHIGLVLHWKELLENVIYLSGTIKKTHHGITLIAGGITAGFLQDELLKRCPSIDYVIKGDAELPLLKLISGSNIRRIPNLAYRDNGKIVINGCSYHVSSKELDGISFSNLRYLFDYERYLKIIDELGFPMFIGRGCIYNCLYCGGSRRAFEIHSGRKTVVRRGVEAVLKDLKRLLKYTDNVYFGYEVDIAYIRRLFEKILSDRMLNRKFRINYGTWSIMGPKLISLYSRICRFGSKKKPAIEISPESPNEEIRKCVRDKALCFTNRQLGRNIEDILKATDNKVLIKVYCSRYHNVQRNLNELLSELIKAHALREYYYRTGAHWNVEFLNRHLATDVASFYWDLAKKNNRGEDNIDILIKTHRRFCSYSAGEFELDNMCIYYPESLSEADIFRFEQLKKWIDLLCDIVPQYYFTITKSVGINKVVGILRNAIDEYHRQKKWDLFENMTVKLLIAVIQEGIRKKIGRVYNANKIYFDDLERLFVKYCYVMESDRKKVAMSHKRVFDKNGCCITAFDYLADDFYRNLDGGIDNIERKRTVNLISNGRVYTIDYKYYPSLGRYFKLD